MLLVEGPPFENPWLGAVVVNPAYTVGSPRELSKGVWAPSWSN